MEFQRLRVGQDVEVPFAIQGAFRPVKVRGLEEGGDELGVAQGGRAIDEDGDEQAFVKKRRRGEVRDGALRESCGCPGDTLRLSVRGGLNRSRRCLPGGPYSSDHAAPGTRRGECQDRPLTFPTNTVIWMEVGFCAT